MSIKKALISVSDKSNIVPFAKKLRERNIEIISTGGTYNLLRENNVEVTQISDHTGFPEIMDGRVKTLNPKIHGGLLGLLDNESHLAQMKENGIDSIDLLVVNLYPFEKVLNSENPTKEDLIENIDIGGPAMLRAAAKNYKHTLVVTNPEYYDQVIDKIDNNQLDENYREKLALEVFSLTSYYDSLIANMFKSTTGNDTNYLNIGFDNAKSLRYGENPAQSATLYGKFDQIFKKLHGKELSYNNIIDIDAASKLIIEFQEEFACAIIKHTNPCGVAIGTSLSDAYNKAFQTDNVSPFGGIIAFNKEVDFDTADTVHKIFTEVIIAPSFSERALELLTKKKDRRLIELDIDKLKSSLTIEYKSVAGGLLQQDYDADLMDLDALKTVTERQPTEDEYSALMFAWKVAKHVKSNAIVYCLKDRTLGIGAGQMSRVDSSRIAREKAAKMGLDLIGSVLASDAFFPFADGLEMAADAGATAVIQPGGSVRDEEVISAANDNNIAMVFTGMRHFRH